MILNTFIYLFIIDLNLGCPQRIAFTGHFGSYLLDESDRDLIVSIVEKLSSNLSIPVFVKIRLLDTVPDTIRLCEQLIDAGAALITIHARYRVNLVGRTGPGARDGTNCIFMHIFFMRYFTCLR